MLNMFDTKNPMSNIDKSNEVMQAIETLARQMDEIKALVLCAIPAARMPKGYSTPQHVVKRTFNGDVLAAQDEAALRVLDLLAQTSSADRMERRWTKPLGILGYPVSDRQLLSVYSYHKATPYRKPFLPKLVPGYLLRNALALRKVFKVNAHTREEANAAAEACIVRLAQRGIIQVKSALEVFHTSVSEPHEHTAKTDTPIVGRPEAFVHMENCLTRMPKMKAISQLSDELAAVGMIHKLSEHIPDPEHMDDPPQPLKTLVKQPSPKQVVIPRKHAPPFEEEDPEERIARYVEEFKARKEAGLEDNDEDHELTPEELEHVREHERQRQEQKSRLRFFEEARLEAEQADEEDATKEDDETEPVSELLDDEEAVEWDEDDTEGDVDLLTEED